MAGDPRTVEDPVTFFRLRALASAPSIGLTTAFVDEHITTFILALGAEWLNEAAKDVPPSIPIPIPRHPLGHLVGTADIEQIAEALELSEYLHALHKVPGVSAIPQALRAQYYQTVLQIAFASRLRRAGAENLALEPAATEGRLSDIRFEYKGHQYRAECFRPTYQLEAEVAYDLARLAHDLLEDAKRQPFIVSIAIDLAVRPTRGVRKEISAIVRQSISEIGIAIRERPDAFPTILATRSGGSVSVSRAIVSQPGAPPIIVRHPEFPQRSNNQDLFMRVAVADAVKISGIHGSIEGMGRSSVGVWLPESLRRTDAKDEDPDAAIERLGRKIEGKIAQARSVDNDARVLIVDAWQTEFVLKGNQARQDRLRRKIVEKHDRVAALLMTRRRWTPELGRHSYLIVPLLREAEPRLPEDLLAGLRD